MSREVSEWIGKSDDHMPPPSVTLRIWTRAKGRCQICDRKLMSGDKWDRDHIVPLADGGQNRESNFQVACNWCHGRKTSSENVTRAKVRSKTKKHAGIRERVSRPFPGSKQSRFKKHVDGSVSIRPSSFGKGLWTPPQTMENDIGE